MNSTTAATAQSPSAIAGAFSASHVVIKIAATTTKSPHAIAGASTASCTVNNVAAVTDKSPSAIAIASSSSHTVVDVTAATAKSPSAIAGACAASYNVINIAATTTAAGLGVAVAESPKCDWAAEKCCLIGLQLMKHQRSGCNKDAHHVCAIVWVTCNNLPELGIAALCHKHHEQYNSPIIRPASTLLQPLLLATLNEIQRKKGS